MWESLVWQKEVMTLVTLRSHHVFMCTNIYSSEKIGTQGLMASKLDQQEKVPAAKADHLSSTPRTQKVEAKNELLL